MDVMNTCANCGGGIGKLETPFVWKGQRVCAACFAKLREGEALGGGVIPYATPARHKSSWRGWLWMMGGVALLGVLSCLGLFTVRTAVSIPAAAPVSRPPSLAPNPAGQVPSNQANGVPTTYPSEN